MFEVSQEPLNLSTNFEKILINVTFSDRSCVNFI